MQEAGLVQQAVRAHFGGSPGTPLTPVDNFNYMKLRIDNRCRAARGSQKTTNYKTQKIDFKTVLYRSASEQGRKQEHGGSMRIR